MLVDQTGLTISLSAAPLLFAQPKRWRARRSDRVGPSLQWPVLLAISCEPATASPSTRNHRYGVQPDQTGLIHLFSAHSCSPLHGNYSPLPLDAQPKTGLIHLFAARPCLPSRANYQACIGFINRRGSAEMCGFMVTHDGPVTWVIIDSADSAKLCCLYWQPIAQ